MDDECKMAPPQIEIISREGNRLRFILRNSSVALANAIRRACISEIYTTAIDLVAVVANNTPFHDEFIVHRIAMIPLTTDKSLIPKDKCTCGSRTGCEKCAVTLTLRAEARDQPVVVYSGDIQSERDTVKPVSDKIPIIKLARGQRLVIEAYARNGLGKWHAKWQPTTVAAYKYLPIIKIYPDRCDGCGKCVSICAPKAIHIPPGKGVPEVRDLLACTTCRDCMRECPMNAIEVSWDDTSFVFTLETTGTLPPEEVLKDAIGALISKFEEFRKELEELEVK
ncbi:DNA-directed RNA polymerase subunit D [archaeon]|nr:DNA-directed RNA polymerase subunit D [archaeon]